tara:strand:+ start:2207 stop:2629 length:423 start_codon:yes stop_codon:yes gene_type:complete
MSKKNMQEINPVDLLKEIEGEQSGGTDVPSPEIKQPEANENLPTFVMDYELPKEMDEDLKQRLLLVEEDMADIEFTNLIGIQSVRNDYKLMKMLVGLEQLISKLVAIPENEIIEGDGGPLKNPLKPEPENYPRKNAIRFK